LIIILLGTNDYYSWPYPTQNEFIAGYLTMMHNIVSSYRYLPAALQPTVINFCGGTMDNDRAPCPNVQQASQLFGATSYKKTYYVEIGQTWLRYPEDYGCLDHRNLKGQQILAAKLLPYVKKIMNW